MYDRSRIYASRQTGGSAASSSIVLGEDAVLIRPTGDRDDFTGEWVDDGPTPETPIRCSTAPVTASDRARARILESSGLRLDAGRRFWTNHTLHPMTEESPGDLIRYPAAGGEIWRVVAVWNWGTGSEFTEALGTRQESLPVAAVAS